MDPLSDYVDTVRKKVRDEGLKNVEEISHDALITELEGGSVELVLLFGVVPFPNLPMEKFLPEMHRVLNSQGTMAVWLFPTTAGVPTSIIRSGLFSKLVRKNDVYTYNRSVR